jgi:hypothetical protein
VAAVCKLGRGAQGAGQGGRTGLQAAQGGGHDVGQGQDVQGHRPAAALQGGRRYCMRKAT